MYRVKRALERALNETPTLVVGAFAVLYVFGGAPVDEASVTDVTENVEAVLGVALWVFARFSVNGPVTLYRRRQARRRIAALYQSTPTGVLPTDDVLVDLGADADHGGYTGEIDHEAGNEASRDGINGPPITWVE